MVGDGRGRFQRGRQVLGHAASLGWPVVNRGTAEIDRAALRAELDERSERLLDVERQLAAGHLDQEHSFRRLTRVARQLIALGGEAEAAGVRTAGRGQAPVAPAQPPQAPAVPASWMPGPPDFVGLGVQRSGTSWWFDQVTAHPEVLLPPSQGGALLRLLPQLRDLRLGGRGLSRLVPRPRGAVVEEWAPR